MSKDTGVFQELSPNKAKKAAKMIFNMARANAEKGKDRRAPFFWGGPGIAKSTVIRDLAREMNYKLIDIRLSQMAPEDLRGIPAVFKDAYDQAYVEWALPNMLPKRDIFQEQDSDGNVTRKILKTASLPKTALEVDESLTGTTSYGKPRSHYWDGAVILFDELPNADPSVQAASYQLVLDGKLGDYIMPTNCVLMAAGNRETDKGNTFPMPAPLANRFIHIYVNVDADEFLKHTIEDNWHPTVIGFLNANKEDIYKFDPKSPDKSFRTPRSWHMVSDACWENDRDRVENYIFNSIIAGAVGTGTQTKFTAFSKLVDKLPNVVDILDGKEVKYEGGDIGLGYALGTSLTYELNHRYKKLTENGKKPTAKEMEKFNKECDNYLAFLLDRIDGEIIIMATKMALTQFKIRFSIKDLKEWPRYSKQYAKDAIRA